jgi:hypothetical protein
MSRIHRRSRPGVEVAEPASGPHVPAVPEPEIDTSDLSILVRAFHGPAGPPVDAPTGVKSAQLSITRRDHDDLQDRQILTFFDGQPWGKVRYGETVTREVTPGPHTVRAFNTLFSKTLTIDVKPGEHVRLRTANGFPRAGWFLMVWLQVTYLRVRLERETE